MNEEEKKAIEMLELLEPDDLNECAMYRNALEIILNYITELEAVANDYEWRMKASNKEILKKGYIPKQKIKDKIEELKNNKEFEMIDFTSGKIEVLQELLEE